MIGFHHNDGGREASGRKGTAGDCVARSLAIATGRSYDECYSALASAMKKAGHPKSARNGIPRTVSTKVFKEFGLTKISLPKAKPTLTEAHEQYGTCIAKTTKHMMALRDGYLQDIYDIRTYEWEGVVRERKATTVWIPTQ